MEDSEEGAEFVEIEDEDEETYSEYICVVFYIFFAKLACLPHVLGQTG